MAVQNSETIRTALQALTDLPAFLKPYTVTGTKLRLPKELGDPLLELVSKLRPILDSVHFEGVEYEYQNEPGASDLAARCDALGYELIVNEKGEQFVIEARSSDNTVEVLFIHRDESDDDLEEWIAREETSSERVRTGEVAAPGIPHGLRMVAHSVGVDVGDIELPKDLEPARELYDRLIREAEAMSVADLRASLAKDSSDVMIAESDDTFAALRTNLSRKGASQAYALFQLNWILAGSKAAPGGAL